MGYVRAKALIGDPKEQRVREVLFLVDTGSFYPVIPAHLAQELGIEGVRSQELVLANKERVKVQLGMAYIKMLDREGGFTVAIMDCPEPLMGVTVLEGLGVKVDPATGEVSHSRPYGMAALIAF